MRKKKRINNDDNVFTGTVAKNVFFQIITVASSEAKYGISYDIEFDWLKI